MSDDRLGPTFLILGAAKSGTTTLYEHLRSHPSVYVSPVKEPRFFALEGRDPTELAHLPHRLVTDWDEYLTLFDGARPDQARGEASVGYLAGKGVVERVQRRVPDAALAVILRHPAEATWSSFQMARRNEGVRASLHELIDSEPVAPRTDLEWDAMPTSVVRSRLYHAHLTRWLAAFPRDQLLILLHDDLARDPATVLLALYRHIGVSPEEAHPLDARHNVGSAPRSARLYRWMQNAGSSRRVLRVLPGSRSVQAAALRLNTRPLPVLDLSTRQRLLDLYREDTVALEDLLGRDLSAWRR